MRSAFIHSADFEKYELAPHHPFKPARAKAVYDLCAKLGLFSYDWIRVVEPKPLGVELLLLFHNHRYIEHLHFANKGEFFDKLIEYNIGTGECPVFPGVYDYSVLCTGAAFDGMRLLITDKCDLAFSPMGGYHHAGSKHAEGFCYINDVAVIITYLLHRGLRVAYVDTDAHHGNGVQNAFYEDNRVLTISFHETGETLYPWSGYQTETGAGSGFGYNVNVPMPPETDDEIYTAAFREIVPPLMEAFNPDLIISVAGADVLAVDPLTHLNLTNNAMADIAEILRGFSKKLLVLGGGGYNINALARAWALVWAVLNDIEPKDEYIGAVGGVFLGETDVESGSLRNAHVYTTGPKKKEISKKVNDVIDYLKRIVFPVHGASG